MRRPIQCTGTIIALVVLALLPSGCTRVYRVSALDKSFINAREQTKGVVHRAYDDVKARREKLKGFKMTVPDHDPAVWQQMKDITEQLAKVGKEMGTYPKRIETLRNQLKLVVGKRKKIRSDDPRLWKQVAGIKDKLRALHGEFKGLTGEYNALNKTFRSLSKKLR